jgi:hypothetical protein
MSGNFYNSNCDVVDYSTAHILSYFVAGLNDLCSQFHYFSEKAAKIMELRAQIIQACNEMTEDMCRRIIDNITVRVEEIARHNSGLLNT